MGLSNRREHFCLTRNVIIWKISTRPLTSGNGFRYERVVIQKIRFYFKGGVELEVDMKGIMFANDVKQVCLAFTAAGVGDGAILGNIMQRSIQVVQDVEGRRVGFGLGTCV
ncbi:hypothetical protein Dsin_032094 [Dipteronia sinensis]|uniref:Peptidase A1 domain-containing protein n=1 Tax=Dipteronia sinensis TaxID=43782 RepID=A0AAD9ZMF2_9ROSI|nr:hypothetical protein Dsin_032094 [Dipteronia sinensis]